MEQTAFQQKLEELKRIKEQRRLEALRQKYSTAPDFSNMNLHDELKVRFDLDELEQLEQKFGNSEPSSGINQSFISGQTQTPVGKILQNTKYMNNFPKPVPFTDITVEGLKGFGEGAIGGFEHGINTMSFGGYDAANDLFFNNGYEKRQEYLKNLANQEGLEKPYKYANYVVEAAFGNLPFARWLKIKP